MENRLIWLNWKLSLVCCIWQEPRKLIVCYYGVKNLSCYECQSTQVHAAFPQFQRHNYQERTETSCPHSWWVCKVRPELQEMLHSWRKGHHWWSISWFPRTALIPAVPSMKAQQVWHQDVCCCGFQDVLHPQLICGKAAGIIWNQCREKFSSKYCHMNCVLDNSSGEAYHPTFTRPCKFVSRGWSSSKITPTLPTP